MTPEEIEIARGFVECGRWKWLPGMLLKNADGRVRIDAVEGSLPGVLRKCRYTNEMYIADVRCGPLPDITDPCTLGGILQLIRDAGGLIRKLSILPLGCQLVVEWPDGRLDSFRETFAGVLLRALQAAPEDDNKDK